jgi:hypothetical protein
MNEGTRCGCVVAVVRCLVQKLECVCSGGVVSSAIGDIGTVYGDCVYTFYGDVRVCCCGRLRGSAVECQCVHVAKDGETNDRNDGTPHGVVPIDNNMPFPEGLTCFCQ